MRVSLHSITLLVLLARASASVLRTSPARRADDAAQSDETKTPPIGFVLLGDSTAGLLKITTVDPNTNTDANTASDNGDGTSADEGSDASNNGTSTDGNASTNDTTDAPPSIKRRQDPTSSTDPGTGADTSGDSTSENDSPKTEFVSPGWSATFCNALWGVEPSKCTSFATDLPNYLTAQDSLNSATVYPAAIQQIKTFLAQGVTPVYVPIQFGNDDEHMGISPETMSRTVQTMVQGVKAAGGTPILLTPLSKRVFKEDHEKVNATRRPFARVILDIAQAEKVKAIDAHWSSLRLCEDSGYELCTSWNREPDDDTYLNDEGKMIFGRLIASEVKMVLPLGTLPLVPDYEHDSIIVSYIMLGMVAKPEEDASMVLKPSTAFISAAVCSVLALILALN